MSVGRRQAARQGGPVAPLACEMVTQYPIENGTPPPTIVKRKLARKLATNMKIRRPPDDNDNDGSHYHHCRRRPSTSNPIPIQQQVPILFIIAIIIIIISVALEQPQFVYSQTSDKQQQYDPQQQVPLPLPIRSASYISLDGLTLVIMFNKPVNLSASIESVEQRQAAAQAAAYEESAGGNGGGEETAAAPTLMARGVVVSRPGRLQAASTTGTKMTTTTTSAAVDASRQLNTKQHHNRNRAVVTFNTRARKPQQATTVVGPVVEESHATSSKASGDLLLHAAAGSEAEAAEAEATAEATTHATLATRLRNKSQLQARGLTCPRHLSAFGKSIQETPYLVGGIQLCAKLLTRKTLKLLHKYKLHNCLWASEVQFLIQLNKPIGGNNDHASSSSSSSSSSSASSPPLAGAQNSAGAQTASSVRITFRRSTLAEFIPSRAMFPPFRPNDQEVSVELSKLALEGLGVPPAPRLALTGPNQVPPCGHFSISAHLSSPYGTQPNESVRLHWSVERVGLITTPGNSSTTSAAAAALAASSSLLAGHNHQRLAAMNLAGQNQVPPYAATTSNQPLSPVELAELQWQALKQLVESQSGSNNLVLDAQLLQFIPQLYEFRLSATFITSLTSFVLNATHQVGRLDFDAPIGTIYGTHMLANEQQVNANSQLALMADIQVPACAQNIKQVGLYWQVSDPRVRFEQTYDPVYLAKSGALPEQALIEFRLNLFYGIRVKKFASASALVPTGDSVLDAQISDGLLMASIVQPQDLIPSSSADQSSSNENAYNNNNNNNNNSNQLVLYAISESQDPQQQQDKYTYQWTCFDGNTAQPCYKSLKLQASNGGTRYDVGQQQQQHNALARPQEPTAVGAAPGGANSQTASPTSGSSNMLLLVDRTRQRQPILRLPLSWFESDAQLWFGLQRFDRQNPSQHSKTEYALISVQPLLHFTQRGREPRVVPALVPQVSIGPLLIGPSRQRATMRNPLTGAMLLVAQAPAVVVGRISPSDKVASFFWRIPNYVYPLHWTTKNVTNPLSQRDELITELQLNQDTLLAHGQHQVQLIVCPDMDIPKITATISLDVVQGVSQCRVELVVTSAPGSKLQQPSLPDGLLGMQPVSTASSTSTPTGSGNGFQSVQRQAASQLPIVVTVNYCNIPLGLSPLTYQLYIIDTSSSDGFIEMNNRQQQQQSTGKPQPASSSSDDEDYINEADELFYENLAQPLSGPQLSPVFVLSGLNGLALMALMQQQQQPAQTSNNQQQQSVVAGTRIRFAARVCDRLQSCRMFYSSSIDPLVLMAQGTATGLSVGLDGAVAAANRSSSLSSSGSLPSKSERLEAQHSQRQQLRLMRQHAIETLRSMLEAAKRANTAGNSIAAISILNALMTLGQRMLPPPQATTTTSTQSSNGSSNNNNKLKAGTARAFPARAKLETSSDVSYSNETTDDQQQQADSDHQIAAAAEGEDQLDRLRDLLQVAMRDCLHYGAQSSQRQFHYTESGQTNLALAAISRILASPQAGFELKFRSLRLIALLVRKSIDNQLSSSSSSSSSQLRLQSLPDLKTIQLAYESLFGAFTQHSTEAFASLASTGHHQHQDNHHNGNNHHRAKRLAKEQVEEEERRTQAGAAESKVEGAEQARTLQRDAQQQQQQQQQQQARLDDDDNKILSRASQSRDRSNSSSSGDPRRELAERTLHHHHNDDDNGRHKRDQQPRQAETDWLLSSSLSSLSPSPPSSSSSSSSSAGVLEPVAPTGGATLESAASSTIATTTTATLATIQPNTAANQQQHTTSLKANRRNKEEAVLAYLKLTRQAHKALIQSIAMQLPLGAVQQFEYQSAGSPRSSTPPSTTSSSANTNNFNTNNNNSNNNNVAAAANRFIAAPQPPAYIVSSLTHQTGLLSDTIDVDLRDFGSISVSFGGAETGVTENVLAKLGRQMRQSTMRCRNGTQTKCSSFVLALTSFAGKAPFRSLDLTTSGGSTGGGTLRAAADIAPRLGVPIIQLDWLSPLDGSNLIELLQTTPTTTSNTGSERDQLVPEDFRATVTFTLPLPQAAALQNATSNDNGNGAPPNAYKCYRFNEAANEWVALAAASDERVPLDEAATAAAGASSEPVRRLRCSFDGYGVVGVFQGKPPPVESSTELSIAVGVACVLALVAIVSMLGCMASKTKARRANHHHKPSLTDTSTDSSSKTNGPSTGSSSYDSDPDAANDDDDQRRNDRQQRTRRTTTPHHHLEHAMAFR